jgi:hypothetical protein
MFLFLRSKTVSQFGGIRNVEGNRVVEEDTPGISVNRLGQKNWGEKT